MKKPGIIVLRIACKEACLLSFKTARIRGVEFLRSRGYLQGHVSWARSVVSSELALPGSRRGTNGTFVIVTMDQ